MRTLALIAAFSLAPLISEDVLEPSVRNEVDHALAIAPSAAWTAATNVTFAVTNGVAAKPASAVARDVFATNGLSASAIALKLVSAQRGDGRWLVGTNDCTVAALRILLSL